MLTDYALAAWTAVLGALLLRQWRANRQRAVLALAASFLATGAAALTGGTFHGFINYQTPAAAAALWKATVYLIGIGSPLLLTGMILATFTPPIRRWLLGAVALKLVVYAVWMATHDDFKYVVYSYVPDMLGVLGLAWWSKVARKAAGAGWIVTGVLLSFLAAAVQRSGFDLHTHFNHNDVYHVMQAGAFYLLFRGGRQLRDRITS
jgi:hypothetical protein